MENRFESSCRHDFYGNLLNRLGNKRGIGYLLWINKDDKSFRANTKCMYPWNA